MKPKETDEICDKCKDRLAKYKCMGCECTICTGCTHLFRIQMHTLDFELQEEKSQPRPSLAYASFFTGEKKTHPTSVGVTDWAICKDCRKGLNKKNAISEIQESEEFKKFVDKLRKVTLASTILTGLDESEVSTDIDVKTHFPNGLFNKYVSKKRTLFGKLLGNKQ